MRRIIIATAGTVTGLVLLLSYPTSLNRSGATATTAAAAEGSSTTEDSATTDQGTDSSGDSADSSSDSSSSGSSGTDSSSGSSSTQSGVSGTFTGTAVQTRFGVVQVEIVVDNGTVTQAGAVQYPTHDHESVQINSWAVPALNDEVVSAQSASISMISGATVTSTGYLTSVQSAFDQAGL